MVLVHLFCLPLNFSISENEASGLRKLFSRKKDSTIDDTKNPIDDKILVEEVSDDKISKNSIDDNDSLFKYENGRSKTLGKSLILIK